MIGNNIAKLFNPSINRNDKSALLKNLLDYYKFDENTGSTVADSLGSNNGTWAGTLGSQWTTGEINSGGNFIAANTNTVLLKNGFILGKLVNASISFWINFTSGSGKAFYSERGTSGNDIWKIEIHNPTTTMNFVHRDDAGTLDQAHGNVVINDGKWHHIVLTKADTTIKGYVDNVLDINVTITGTNTLTDASMQVNLGGDAQDGSAYYQGVLDEVGLWNKTLSVAEINYLYNGGAGLQYNFSTLPQRINPIGMNPGFYVNVDTTYLQNTTIPLLKQAGIRYVRYQFSMLYQEPVQGIFGWGQYFGQFDQPIQILVNNGFKIIAIMLQYAIPAWASAGAFYPPTPAVYQTWCQQTAAHFGNLVDLYEMGNEPNESIYWGPYQDGSQTAAQTIAAYTALLKAGYNGIKAGNSNAKVINAGLARSDVTLSFQISMYDFLTGMYANGAKGYFDYFSCHPYAYPANNPNASDTFNVLNGLRAIMNTNNDPTHMILTELGKTTYSGGVTEAQQATHFNDVYRDFMFGNHKYVDICCQYDFVDNSTNIDDPESNYGILHNDLSYKPAFNTFSNLRSSYSSSFSEIVI